MSMELEIPKAIWRTETFGGSLFDVPAAQLLPGIRARLKAAKRKALVEDLLQGGIFVAAVLLFGRKLLEAGSTLERAGLILMIAGAAVVGVEILIHRWKARSGAADLSVGNYYRKEKRSVEAAMRMRRRIWGWSSLFVLIGFLPFFFATHPSQNQLVFFSLFIPVMIVVSRRAVERRIREDLLPLREALSRKIEKFEADGDAE